MAILLHDYHELEERASRHLSIWKGWHVTLYLLGAVFGLMNYTFIQSTGQLFDDNCVLFPRKLNFHIVKLPNATDNSHMNTTILNHDERHDFIVTTEKINDLDSDLTNDTINKNNETETKILSDETMKYEKSREKREDTVGTDKHVTITNFTLISNTTTSNKTHRIVLNTARSLFAKDSVCQFPIYMPILSSVFCLVWATLFTMCPSGGYTRSGLRQPWRILAPALLFAIVLVGLTGHSFSQTNSGLQALCAAFSNVTNTTACSPVNAHLERAWNASWGVGVRVAAARASSAGVWASWACAGALMLARCLAAPDFVVRRTAVVVKRDPQQKITAFLKQSTKKNNSQRKSDIATLHDDSSVKSEPTLTSELVTVSIEQPGPKSVPTSLKTTPAKRHNKERDELLELVYIPQKEKSPSTR